MTTKLTQFRALSFDCYGTLIDWERGIVEALKIQPRFKDIDPEVILSQFAALESKHQSAHPTMLYPQILELVIKDVAPQLKIELSEEDQKTFGRSVADWPPFPDTTAALRELQKHYKLVILSNIDRESFALSEKRMNVKFDLIITAQDVGSYKPDLNNFEQLLKRVKEVYGAEKIELLHVFQSLFHDAVPANKMGISTTWINRRHNKAGGGATPDPETAPVLDWEFKSLAEFAEAVEVAHK